jgi:uncharacterized membrane protein YtjA (UPF0391 family)
MAGISGLRISIVEHRDGDCCFVMMAREMYLERMCGREMLRFALAFLVIALMAAALQYFGVAAAMAGIARMIFFIFMLLFLFCLAGHIYRGS